MTFRLALRSLTGRPVRSLVLAGGFGLGIGVMASLLGVGEVILEQARAPELAGGGDLVLGGASGRLDNARFVMSEVLARPPFDSETVAAAPSLERTLYLTDASGVVPVQVRGGVPSLDRALGDAEVAGIASWRDTDADRDWARPRPGDVLRAMDRFHPVPRAERFESWWEWLYFNGRVDDRLFYLAFLAGPPSAPDRRVARVGLHVEIDGTLRSFGWAGEVDAAALLETAPDLEFGPNRVRLDELRYVIELDLRSEQGTPLRGTLTLEAVPGRSLAPLSLRGAGGWVSGYVAPVLSGPLSGRLLVETVETTEEISFDGGTGYHDHNWGFWDDVAWQWGQVSGDGISLLYGRIRPPLEVADPERLPGFLLVLGPEGPLGRATDLSIEERGPAGAPPQQVRVRARSEKLDVSLELSVEKAIRNPGMLGNDVLRLMQLSGPFRVRGRVAEREIDFTAQGTAETFRR